MEEHIDLAIATGVFLFFLALCAGLGYYSALAYASSMLPPDVAAVAYRYLLKIPINYDPSSKVATIGVGLEGVRAVVAVIKTSGAAHQVRLFEERVLPTKVSADSDEWVVAITSSGYGVKHGAAYPRGLVVTTAGVYPLASAPGLYPQLKVTTGYEVEPSEFMVVRTSAGPQTRAIDDGYLSKLRMVGSKLVGPSDPRLKGYAGLVMLREEYSS